MYKKGDKVLLNGVKLEVLESTKNEVLVEVKTMIDGITKTIKQWYHNSVVDPVITPQTKNIKKDEQELEMAVLPEEESKPSKRKK